MTRGLLGILKLVLFALLLPVVIAVISGFNKELAAMAANAGIFWMGVIAYTVTHLFVFTPQGLYRFWQSVFLEVCSFAGTAANLIVLAIPVITTVLLLAYFLIAVIFNQTWGTESLIFFTGFTLALHIILSAQELYEEDESKLKGHYLFNISLMTIVNIALVAGLLDLIFKKFSFMDFFNTTFEIAQRLYAELLSTAGIRF